MDIGKRVRELRKEQGLSIAELAEKAELTPNAVSRIELGHRAPTAVSVASIARGLNVDPGELFRPPKKAEAPQGSGRLSGEEQDTIAAAGQLIERQRQTKAKERALEFFEETAGHAYLAMIREEASRVAKSAESIDRIHLFKEMVDAERDIAEAFLETHNPDPDLRVALEEAIRQRLYWLIDLEARRRELREAGEGEGDKVLVAMGSGS